MAKDSKTAGRRRTCVDRLRRDLAERQRRRGKNPATSIVLQLLGILSIGLSVLPRLPMPVISSGNNFRNRALGNAPAPDEDRGPTAAMMERGIEPTYYRTARSSRVSPSWSRLVKDLKRRSTADEARRLIEKRVPAEAVEWLRLQIQLEDWMALRSLGPPGSSEEEISANALKEAEKWNAGRAVPPTSPPASAGETETEMEGPKP